MDARCRRRGVGSATTVPSLLVVSSVVMTIIVLKYFYFLYVVSSPNASQGKEDVINISIFSGGFQL